MPLTTNSVGMYWRTESLGPILSPPVTLTRKVPEPLGTITAYSFFEKGGTYTTFPTDWILEVSEDGADWQQIDQRIGVSWDVPTNQSVRKLFELPQPYEGNATYFRWTFTKSLAKDYMHIYEIEFHNSTTRFTLPSIAENASGYSTFIKMKSGSPSPSRQVGDRATLARQDQVHVDEFGQTWLLCDGRVLDVRDYPELTGKKGIMTMEPGAVVPWMTSHTKPDGYVATASSESSASSAVWNLFDIDTRNTWVSASNIKSGWVQMEIPESVRITGYYLQGSNATMYLPKNWTIDVSENGIGWTSIDTRIGNTVSIDQRFEVENPQSGRYIRLNVTEITSGNKLQIRQLQFYGDGCQKFQMPDIAADANGHRVYMLAKKY